MPLIDLQTNLKSLKFTGIAPYVTKDINNPPVYNTLSNEISSRVDDVSRLTKMLMDKPGYKFLANQALLQASDPANFDSNKNSVIGRAIDTAGSILKNTARAVGTVIGQAGVNGTGTHFILQSPEYYYTAEAAGPLVAAGATEIVPESSKRSPLEARTQEIPVARFTNVTTRFFDTKGRHEPINILKSNVGQSLDSKYGYAGQNRSDKVGRYDIQQTIPDGIDTVPIIFGKYPETDYKIFRGFIGSINDNYQANWASNQFVGRMEQFFTYTGFSRNLSFPITVPIFSKSEQASVYNKVNALVSHTAPEYRPGSGIPQGIITWLQVGDYLKTPGVLNSVSITINNDVPWSLGEGETPMLLPQVLQLQVQFTPIHETTPQYYNDLLTDDGAEMPFIANSTKLAKSEYQEDTNMAEAEVVPVANVEQVPPTVPQIQAETTETRRLQEWLREYLSNRMVRTPRAPKAKELTPVIEVGNVELPMVDFGNGLEPATGTFGVTLDQVL